MAAPPFDPIEMIKKHATKCNITVHALLLKACVPPHYFNRWTSGRTSINTRTLLRILNVEPEEWRR